MFYKFIEGNYTKRENVQYQVRNKETNKVKVKQHVREKGPIGRKNE